jgi:hypothetical protein
MSGVSYGLEEKVVVVTVGNGGEPYRDLPLRAEGGPDHAGEKAGEDRQHLVNCRYQGSARDGDLRDRQGRQILTKVLASELAAFNIQVNSVAPGMVRTDFSKPFWSTPAIHDQIVKAIPAGRIAETADLVPIVLLLASRHTDYITGQTITVDGGASAI